MTKDRNMMRIDSLKLILHCILYLINSKLTKLKMIDKYEPPRPAFNNQKSPATGDVTSRLTVLSRLVVPLIYIYNNIPSALSLPPHHPPTSIDLTSVRLCNRPKGYSNVIAASLTSRMFLTNT